MNNTKKNITRLHFPSGQRAADARECSPAFIKFLADRRVRVSPRYIGRTGYIPRGRYYDRISKRTLYRTRCRVQAGEILIPSTQLDLIRFARQASTRWYPIIQIHRREALGFLVDRKIVEDVEEYL